MKLPIFSTKNDLHLIIVCIVICLTKVYCLYEDQVGKWDWRKQFIGIPKFVYGHSHQGNIIIGTESNVISSLSSKDGSIRWRRLLPDNCQLDHMSILKSIDDEYLIRTSCKTSEESNKSQIWSPQNGLLASEARYKQLADDETAESHIADSGHEVAGSRAFTISDDVSLTVAEDGEVSLNVNGRKKWIREESLASVTAVAIVKLPTESRDRFGLKKTIVLLTENGKIFGIDTISGQIIWQLFERDLSIRKTKLVTKMVVAKQSDDSPDESRVHIVKSNGLVISINPVVGALIEKKLFPNAIKQIIQTEEDVQQMRGTILLDNADQVHVYPESLKNFVSQNIDKYYITVADRFGLESYKLTIGPKAISPKLVWSFPINETEKIVNLSIKRIDEEIHSPARVLGDRGILYKYVNPNLIAIMTQSTTDGSCSPEHSINIYLVDGVTGALAHSVFHPKTRAPANLVHSENWLVYSYYNIKHRRTEVSSLEMFEGVSQVNSTAFSSLTRSAIKPKLIEHKSFIFPNGIDAMIDTVTLRGMTNRHIIVALPSGSLLEIPKIFLDPRRPINMLMEHREEGLIAYMPELPIPSESIINYDQTVLGIKKITTSPAMLESTSLVFAYGLDFFFTRVTPSKTFDILKDDFNHLLIAAVLLALVVASYVCKLLAQRKALHAAWK